MGSTGKRRLTNLATHIRAAYPRHAVKQLERALGVSDSQADRIVKTGRAPGKFRASLIQILENALESNRAEIERLQRELKALDYAEMVERAAVRRAEDDRSGDPTLFGRAAGTEKPLLKE